VATAGQDPISPLRPPRPVRHRGAWTPGLVLGASLALTIAATLSVALSTRGRDEARFENAVQSATDRIVGRLDIYTSTLRGGAALFAAGPVTRDVFQRYAHRLDIQRWYPGIQGIGWTPRLARGLAGEVDERYSIAFLEPVNLRNSRAIGFDMYSEPTRRAAMQRARDQAEPALSGRVTLVQELEDAPLQPGFLIYVPVYDDGVIPAGVEARRATLLGFVYAPFRAHDLFDGIFGREAEPRVSIAVYDGVQVDDAALLFASDRVPAHSPRQRAVSRVQIAGRHWTVVYESQPPFEAASTRRFVPMVLVAGLLVSAWLTFLALGQGRARAAAETANYAKSTFLATMSHELRTPLNAIGGFIELIQIGVAGPVTEQQQTYLKRVQRAQQQLLGLINDVLNYARLDAGAVSFTLRPVDVPRLVSDAMALLALQAQHGGVRLRDEGGPHVHMLADVEKARQILLNLLSNAVKFTDPGGSVTTRWSVAGGRVRISIADTGIGIPAERLRTIFDPFVQVDANLTRQKQGVGLGLAISRDLARGMDGDIEVTSEVGRGSTFTLSLPQATRDAVVDHPTQVTASA
jgi:signal transduction histidine kinase